MSPRRRVHFGALASALLLAAGTVLLLSLFAGHSSAAVLRPSSALAAGKPKAPVAPSPQAITGKTGWHLAFNANFQGKAPDPNLWQPSWFGSGGGISGPVNQLETACYNPANVQTSPTGVNLVLSPTPTNCQGQARPYTGAILSTNPYDGRASGGFQYSYGVLQAKIYLPGVTKGRHVNNWPVLMTIGQGASGGENDSAEGLFGAVCAHYHAPGISGYVGLGGCAKKLGPGWHVFTTDWEPGSVTYYYDGKRFRRVTRDIDSSPQYIVLLNTTAAFDTNLVKPDTMKVAYVKVWQRASPTS